MDLDLLSNILPNKPQATQVSNVKDIQTAMKILTSSGEVKGEVLDVSNSLAKIQTSDGQVINGRLANSTQLNIGDIRSFTVHKNEEGSVFFSIVPEDEDVLLNNTLKNALENIGKTNTDKNIEMAKSLVKNNMPVNKEQFQNLSRALALIGEGDKGIDKALFMLKNAVPLNSKNVNNLIDLTSKSFNQMTQLNNIEESINNLTDNTLKLKLVSILTQGEETQNNSNINNNTNDLQTNNAMQSTAGQNNINQNTQTIQNTTQNIAQNTIQNMANNESINAQHNNIDNTLQTLQGEKPEAPLQNTAKADNIERALTEILERNVKPEDVNIEDKITKSMKFDAKDSNVNDLEKFLNDNNKKIDDLVKELTKELSQKPQDESIKHLLDQVVNVKDKIEFTNYMKDNLYVQIPLNMNDSDTNGELLVFKDKKNKNKNKSSVSALIGLDTVNLGRFETFVEKENDSLNLQIRLENKDVINLVKENISSLELLLSNYNLKINSIIYKNIEESFSIVSNKEENSEEVLNNLKLSVHM